MSRHDFITVQNEAIAPQQSQERSTQRRGAGVWIVLVLLVLAGGAGYWWYAHYSDAHANASSTQQQGPRAVPVVTATAHKGDLPIYVDALGLVTALNEVTVRTRVDGELTSINFIEGQEVHEGDLLAQIDPRPFQVQLEQSEGQFARDQATLKNAQVELERDQAAGDAIAKQQLDTQAATVDQLQAGLKIDQAMIDSAKLQLTYCQIIAPISGRVGLRTVDKGNIIHTTDPNGVADITQVRPISVVFTISEDQLPAVLQHTNAGEQLPVLAYNRDLTKQLATGMLLAIDNRVDSSTGTVRIKSQFQNESGTLFPSQFVNVRLLVDTVRGAVIVPAAAVQRGPDSAFAYVVQKDDTVDMKTVTVGPSEAEQTVITKGLAAGDVIVTDGVDKLAPGVKVTMRKPTTQSSTTRPGASPSSNEAGA